MHFVSLVYTFVYYICTKPRSIDTRGASVDTFVVLELLKHPLPSCQLASPSCSSSFHTYTPSIPRSSSVYTRANVSSLGHISYIFYPARQVSSTAAALRPLYTQSFLALQFRKPNSQRHSIFKGLRCPYSPIRFGFCFSMESPSSFSLLHLPCFEIVHEIM